jgi:hypothetical protein
MGANSYIGVVALLVVERNPSLGGVQWPDPSKTTEVVVATDPRRRDDRSG